MPPPLGPSSTVVRPAGTDTVTRSRTRFAPNDFDTSRTSIITPTGYGYNDPSTSQGPLPCACSSRCCSSPPPRRPPSRPSSTCGRASRRAKPRNCHPRRTRPSRPTRPSAAGRSSSSPTSASRPWRSTGRRRTRTPGPPSIICPGGAHIILAYDHEGTEVAEFLAKHGVTGDRAQVPGPGPRQGPALAGRRPGRPAGDPRRPQPRRRVEDRPEADRHPRLLGRRRDGRPGDPDVRPGPVPAGRRRGQGRRPARTSRPSFTRRTW